MAITTYRINTSVACMFHKKKLSAVSCKIKPDKENNVMELQKYNSIPNTKK
jgi:hypothetical protein